MFLGKPASLFHSVSIKWDNLIILAHQNWHLYLTCYPQWISYMNLLKYNNPSKKYWTYIKKSLKVTIEYHTSIFATASLYKVSGLFLRGLLFNQTIRVYKFYTGCGYRYFTSCLHDIYFLSYSVYYHEISRLFNLPSIPHWLFPKFLSAVFSVSVW